MFDPKIIKNDFPILSRIIDGKPLVYLDSASTSQKPKSVINAITNYYENSNANIHRAVYAIAQEADAAYEATRQAVRTFINAHETEEIIFTRNTTESINLVAYTWAQQNISEGDIIMVSALEHHSNLVPWQQVCERKGARLSVIPLSRDAETPYTLDLEWFKKNLTPSVKLVAITHASNVTGTINPIKEIIEFIRATNKNETKILIDGAQSAPHIPVDMRDLDCDFFAFSSHKMLGPTGVGVLYGKREILETMNPFLFGGDMIREVHQRDATWNDLPWKFEAGTSNIADVIAFKAAIDYLTNLGMENVHAHDKILTEYAREKLEQIPHLKLHIPKRGTEMTGVISFAMPGIHPHDIAEILNSEQVCIRGGKHCAGPLMESLSVPATARISFSVYNTTDDIDIAINAILKAKKIFKI